MAKFAELISTTNDAVVVNVEHVVAIEPYTAEESKLIMSVQGSSGAKYYVVKGSQRAVWQSLLS